MREMKYSGIEWIGIIPSDWYVARLKQASICKDSMRVPVDASERTPGPYPYWGAGKVMDYVHDYLFDEELVLLGEDGAPFFDKSRDVAHLVNEKIWVNNHIHVLKPRDNVDARYLTYYLNIVDYGSYIYGSILNKLTQGQMREIFVVFPSYAEQRKIAEYLQAKCSKVDILVQNQKCQIEKLQQYKQSLITKVITKGLDAQAPMKDSGVEWIGQTNERFDIIPIRSLFKIKKDIIGKEPDTVLSITQTGLRVKDITENSGQMAESYANYQIVNIGDFAMNHMDLLTGGIGISEYEGVTSPDYRVFVLKNKAMNPRYFLYVFQMYYRNKIFYAFGQGAANVGRWRLPAQNFNNIAIPVPPIEEQNAIVEYLDNKITTIDELISIKQEKIVRLTQYKKSLIYEYVTGKKEVM